MNNLKKIKNIKILNKIYFLLLNYEKKKNKKDR